MLYWQKDARVRDSMTSKTSQVRVLRSVYMRYEGIRAQEMREDVKRSRKEGRQRC